MKQTEILQTNQLYIFHFIKSKLKLVSEAEPSCLSIICICFCSARLKVKSSIQLCTKRQNLETPKPLFNSCWLPTPKPPFNLALLAANSCRLQTDSILAGLTWLCLCKFLLASNGFNSWLFLLQIPRDPDSCWLQTDSILAGLTWLFLLQIHRSGGENTG